MEAAQTIRLATHAMATRFEFVLNGEDPVQLRAAGEEALREINRIGKRFNYYDASSELSRVNREAFGQDLPVAGDLFELFQQCEWAWKVTKGAFDPTIGPLMRLWNFGNDRSQVPSQKDVTLALARTGWQHVVLDPKKTTVRFLKTDCEIDLGGIAKGWALDEARALLQQAGVQSGLIHGGTSSVIGIGTPPNENAWTVGIEDPYESLQAPSWFEKSYLKNAALSVSAIRGKSTTIGDIEYGHVINPANGMAISGPFVSIVEATRAVTADALSTALLAGFHIQRDFTDSTVTRADLFHKIESGWKLKFRS